MKSTDQCSQDRAAALEMVARLNEFYATKARERSESAPPAIVPTSEQLPAICGPLTPTMVVAGAGAGKTWVMAMRVLYLVYHHHIEPHQILGLTFSNKAVAELAARIRGMLTDLVEAGMVVPAGELGESSELSMDVSGWFASAVEVSTYNSFAASIVRDFGITIGVEPDTSVMGAARAYQVVEEIVRSYDGPLPDYAAGTLVEAVIQLESQLSDHRLTVDELAADLQEKQQQLNSMGTPLGGFADEWSQALTKQLQLLPLVEKLRTYKREHRLMGFNDQLSYAYRIVNEHPQVAAQIRSRYRAVLLDEFQDTSVIQLDLLSALFQDLAVTAVGDPNQSIYGFRGASAASLALFENKFCANTQLRQCSLTQARRNQSRIREAANAVSTSLRVYSQKLGVAVEPLREPEGNSTHQAGAAAAGKVRVAFAHSEADETQIVVRAIENWIREREASGRSERYAVLSRFRRSLIPIRDALLERGIECEISGVGGLLLHPAVMELRAILQAAVYYQDGPAALRLLTSWGAPTADIESMARYARDLVVARTGDVKAEVSLLDAIDSFDSPHTVSPRQPLSEDGRRAVGMVAERLRQLRQHLDQPLQAFIGQAIRLFDLDLDLLSSPFDSESLEVLDQFLMLASEFESEGDSSPESFLQWLNLVEEKDDRPLMRTRSSETSIVELMTIHQSKGLEWDRVAVVGLDQTTRNRTALSFYKCVENIPSTALKLWKSYDLVPNWLRQDRQLVHPRTGEKIWLLPQPPELDAELLSDAKVTRGKVKSKALQEALSLWATEAWEHKVREETCAYYVAFTRPAQELLLTGKWFSQNATLMNRPLDVLLLCLEQTQVVEPITAAELWGEEDGPEPFVTVCDYEVPEADTSGEIYPPHPSLARVLLNQVAHDVKEILDRDATAIGDARALRQQLSALGAGPQDEWGKAMEQVGRQLLLKRHSREAQSQIITLDHLSATAAARYLSDPEGFAASTRRPLPQEPSGALTVGTAFHRWAQQWLGRGGQLSEAAQPLTAEVETEAELFTPFNSDDIPADVKKQVMKLARRAVALFGERPDGIIGVEVPLAVAIGPVTVRLQVDALMEIDGRLNVIDWKTSAPPTKERPRHARDYAVQMEVYRRAVAHTYRRPLHDIDVKLVFLGGEVDSTHRVVTLEQLNELLGGFDFETAWNEAFCQ